MLLDTHAWIEYFTATKKGERVREMVLSGNASTAMPTIAELTSWAKKNGVDAENLVGKVATWSSLLPFDEKTALLAGQLHQRYRTPDCRWGMVDAMIYATAVANRQELLTGDAHFTGKPGCVMI